MKYEPIGSPFEVSIDCPGIGLNELGRFNREIHNILNHVCISLYEDKNESDKVNRNELTLPQIPTDFNRDEILVRADVIGVRKGSIIYDIQAVLAQVFTTAGAANIAINLISNVIWCILKYSKEIRLPGAVGVTGKCDERNILPIPATTAKRQVKPKIEKLITALSYAPHGGRVVIRNGEDFVEITIYGPNKQ